MCLNFTETLGPGSLRDACLLCDLCALCVEIRFLAKKLNLAGGRESAYQFRAQFVSGGKATHLSMGGGAHEGGLERSQWPI